jgi:hypothetical protein
MSVVWTVLGTFAQGLLALVLFMLVAFSGGGFGSNGSISGFELGVLNLSLYLLPGLCALSALIVIALHLHSSGAAGYAWYLMPVAGAALYVAYVTFLMHRR